jgi:hypothetical protein
LQEDLDRLGEWAAENAMKINPSKCKAVRFMRARVKHPLNYTIGDQLIPEASSCKYLGIIFRSDLNWADHSLFNKTNLCTIIIKHTKTLSLLKV